MRDLDKLRGDVAERIHHAVAVEVSSLNGFVEIAAIGEIPRTSSSLWIDAIGLLPDGLIGPVPDAPARKRFIGVEDIPVLLEIAHRIAHRMGVFAAEIGLVRMLRIVIAVTNLPFEFGHIRAKSVARLSALGEPVDERIHRRVDVRVAVAALEMDEARGIELAHGSHRLAETVAVPRLVAH